MVGRMLRWLAMAVGGTMLGAGLFLQGQVTLVLHLRAQVQETFFLWRAIGRMSFLFQDQATRAALLADELPEHVLRNSQHAAAAMMTLGALLLIVAPFARQSPKQHRPAKR
jgi:hypothetical protein